MRVVAAIGNQCGPFIGPVESSPHSRRDASKPYARMQGRVLVEGVVALTVKDQTVRVVQTAHRRCQVQCRVVAVFTNTGTESIQNLLCFSRQIAVRSLSYALLLFFCSLMSIRFLCKEMSGCPIPSYGTTPRYRAQERGTTVLSASLIRGARRSQRLSPGHHRQQAQKSPYATGEKNGYGKTQTCPSLHAGRVWEPLMPRAAHPEDAPPRVRIEKKSIT